MPSSRNVLFKFLDGFKDELYKYHESSASDIEFFNKTYHLILERYNYTESRVICGELTDELVIKYGGEQKLINAVGLIPGMWFAHKFNEPEIKLDGVEVIMPMILSPGVGLKKIIIGDDTKAIREKGFHSSFVNEVVIGKNVKEIGYLAFTGSYLKRITIPGGVTKLKHGLFRSCKRLRTVVLEEGITSVSNDIFYGCDKLSSVEFPSTIIVDDNLEELICNPPNDSVRFYFTGLSDEDKDKLSYKNVVFI